jgi:hypothetical protein
MGYFMRMEWACPGVWKRNWLRSPYIFLPSFFLLLLLHPWLFRCFFVWFVRFEAFPPTIPVYILLSSAGTCSLYVYHALEPDLQPKRLCSSIPWRTESFALSPRMANTNAKHHDSQSQNTKFFRTKVMDLMQDKSTKTWSSIGWNFAPKDTTVPA